MTDEKPVLLFDGVCNLCSGIVQFIIKRDPEGEFLFASLQSDSAKQLLRKKKMPEQDLSTFVYVSNHKFYTKSTAALLVLKDLGGVWSLFYSLMIIPKPVRDKVYDWIARNRYKWFGKKEECMIPSDDIKKRFLDWND